MGITFAEHQRAGYRWWVGASALALAATVTISACSPAVPELAEPDGSLPAPDGSPTETARDVDGSEAVDVPTPCPTWPDECDDEEPVETGDTDQIPASEAYLRDLIESSWDQMSRFDQDWYCDEWESDPDYLVELWTEGGLFDERVVRDFFTDVC